MAQQEGKYESGNAVRDTILHDQTGRMLKLYQEREKNRKKLAAAKKEIDQETETKRKFSHIETKFGGSSAEVFEEEFRRATVGLVSVEQFREKRRRVDELIRQSVAEPEVVKRKVVQKKCNAKLSFDDEEGDDEDDEAIEEEEIEEPKNSGFLGKNPFVDTSFLPDEARRLAIAEKKEKLTKEWIDNQEKLKKQIIKVQFSYWDGAGHRRSIDIQKGMTVKDFLTAAFKILEADFPDLRGKNQNGLIYIKEDLIIPTYCTFYDLIRSGAQGPHGYLFDYEFDSQGNTTSEPQTQGGNERHAGKVVDRRWYERNKHVFPASKWEHYDPNKKYERAAEIGKRNSKGKLGENFVGKEPETVPPPTK